MEIKNNKTIIISKDKNFSNDEVKIVDEKVKNYNAIEIKNSNVSNITLIGDREVNDGEGYNGVVISSGVSSIKESDISEFGGYGIVTSNGVNNISFYDIKDEDGNVVYGVSYKNLEKVDDEHIHLIKRINVENISQFELGYTFGYMGYNYCNGRKYIAKFYNNSDDIIAEIESVQYDKVQVPEGAKLVDFVIEQSYLPTNGNSDFNGVVLFISDYCFPQPTIEYNYIHDNTRENIAICGGQNVLVKNNKLENSWLGLVIEDGWELCKDVEICNNVFKGNGRDVIAASGRNLKFYGNKFSNWVNIGDRVEGLKFNNNTLEVTKEDHIKTNDRFVVNLHKGEVELNDNTFINARVQITSDEYAKNNSKVVAKGNTFVNTHITTSPSFVVFEDSILNAEESVMVTGNFKNSKFCGKVIGATGLNLYNCIVQNVSRYMCQKIGNIQNSNFINVGLELDNNYNNSALNINKSVLENVSFVINGRGDKNPYFKVENSTIVINKPLIDAWNISGTGKIEFINCNIIATEDIEYLFKTAWFESDINDFSIILDNCTIDNKIKNVSNNKIKKYIITK